MATQEQRAVQQRRAAAASTRRLSNRDLRELVRLTEAMSATEASAFERRGVVVHLVRQVKKLYLHMPATQRTAIWRLTGRRKHRDNRRASTGARNAQRSAK